MKPKMEKCWAFVKKYYEPLGYFVLAGLLFGACFFSAFAWIAAVYIVGFAALLHDETKGLGLILCSEYFSVFFNHIALGKLNLFSLLLGVLKVLVCLLYLLRVIKKELKLNWKVLIPIGLFFIYIVLPFHEVGWHDLISTVLFFAVLYVVFEERRIINYGYLVRILAAGLILSSVYSLFKNVSPLLAEILPDMFSYGHIVFHGLVSHQNYIAHLSFLCICGLLILKFMHKISLPEFFCLFTPIIIFGYMTLSRAFIISITAALVTFGLFYLVKHKVKAFPLLCILLAVIALVAVIRLNDTKIYIDRVSGTISDYIESQKPEDPGNNSGGDTGDNTGTTPPDQPEVPSHSGVLAGLSKEKIRQIFAGEILFDPGRDGLRELYLMNWKSSTKTKWFGLGISRPWIGKMNAHNLYLQELWKHGIVGYMFYVAMIACSINWKKWKQIKLYFPVLIILIPYFLITLVEACIFDYFAVTLTLTAIGCLEQTFYSKQRKQKTKILFYNPSLKMGGTEIYMLNLIEHSDMTKFDFDVMIRSNTEVNLDLVNRLKSVGVTVRFLGSNPLSQLLNFAVYLAKNCGQYDVMHINATSGIHGIVAYLGKDFGQIEQIIFHSHMGGLENQKDIADQVGISFAKFYADHLVACSVSAADFMYGKKYTVKHQVQILHNSIDVNKFKFNPAVRKEYREKLGIKDRTAMLFVGRFDIEKNPARMVEICAEVIKRDPSYHLLMVGDGILRNEVETKIKQLDIADHVTLLGIRNDVNSIMQAADILVMTSVYEGLGIVAIEAQAAGLPVVLSTGFPHEAKVTNNCAYVSLDEGNDQWAEAIIQQKNITRQDTSADIVTHQYDNDSAVKVVEALYLSQKKN